MIAKEVATGRTGGSFGGLVTYLTNSQGKQERVGAVRLGNCVSADVESAILEVENTQARNRRARHTTYHLVLAFPPGEEPAAHVIEQVERRACEALGFASHQRVSVVHHDTDHLHVHIAINRVHPVTAKAHSPSFSKLALDGLCVELEAAHRLRASPHRARRRQTALGAGDLAVGPGCRAPDMERVGGLESLIGFVQRECADELRMVASWAQLHEVAAAHGLQARLRGNGLVLVATDSTAVKASSVSRDLSKAALERRLGPFEGAASASVEARVQYRKQPPLRGTGARLYEEYLRERETAVADRRRAIEALREQQLRDEQRLGTASRRRWATVRLVAKGRVASMLWHAYARRMDRRERDRARQQHRADLRAATARRSIGWLDWLRERAVRGDADALAALRARRGPDRRSVQNAVRGDAPSQRDPGVVADSVTATGTVIYRVPGGSIRDDGNRMHLTTSASSDAAAEALLRLALARYGSRIGVDGDGGFQARLQRVAHSAALPITLVGGGLEARRVEPLAQRTVGAPGTQSSRGRSR